MKRYEELKKDILFITHKTLSCYLKELEGYSLVNRKEFHQNRLFDTVDKIYRNIILNNVVYTVVTKLSLTVFQTNKESKKCKIIDN
ncbi:winged helix-turn-helix transcriptional regulator [Clostridium sp. DL-VIII]|uniref:winged helix-turn-helix transcriptional regulator n=1 Tax=Clostridium sp. DL-VIII TaxID=641107 RepID=UPI000305F9D9|nr:winged helix-turn-helix transcriptional regulator [Clostridium sp. DL-VIII]